MFQHLAEFYYTQSLQSVVRDLRGAGRVHVARAGVFLGSVADEEETVAVSAGRSGGGAESATDGEHRDGVSAGDGIDQHALASAGVEEDVAGREDVSASGASAVHRDSDRAGGGVGAAVLAVATAVEIFEPADVFGLTLAKMCGSLVTPFLLGEWVVSAHF